MSSLLDLLSDDTYQELGNIYHDLGSRMLIVYEEMYEKYNLVMRCTSGFRSPEEQDKLYAKGRTAPGKIVTNAKAGESWHNFGLAIDSCFTGEDPYLQKNPNGKEIWEYFGKLCTDNGLIWGGHFLKLHDTPHAEKRYGLSLKECYNLYQQVGITGLWRQLDSKLQTIINQEILH